MVIRLASTLVDAVPFATALLAVVTLASIVTLDRDLVARAGVATAGSALVAYGLREVLRAVGGGYYCCNHGIYATLGLAIAAVGWVLLVAAIRGPRPAGE